MYLFWLACGWLQIHCWLQNSPKVAPFPSVFISFFMLSWFFTSSHHLIIPKPLLKITLPATRAPRDGLRLHPWCPGCERHRTRSPVFRQHVGLDFNSYIAIYLYIYIWWGKNNNHHLAKKKTSDDTRFIWDLWDRYWWYDAWYLHLPTISTDAEKRILSNFFGTFLYSSVVCAWSCDVFFPKVWFPKKGVLSKFYGKTSGGFQTMATWECIRLIPGGSFKLSQYHRGKLMKPHHWMKLLPSKKSFRPATRFFFGSLPFCCTPDRNGGYCTL